MDFDLDTMYCGAVKRGDIFLCRLEKKETAVVVLQDSILNERLPTVAVVPIEPHIASAPVFKNEIVLSAKETGFGGSGICMLHKMQPISRQYLVAKKGEVSKEKLAALYAALDINLGRFRD